MRKHKFIIISCEWVAHKPYESVYFMKTLRHKRYDKVFKLKCKNCGLIATSYSNSKPRYNDWRDNCDLMIIHKMYEL